MNSSASLKGLINALNLSVYAFERKIGVGGSAISKAIERDTAIKEETIQKILRTFPNVSRHWLMVGEGEMFVTSQKSNNANADTPNEDIPVNSLPGNEYQSIPGAGIMPNNQMMRQIVEANYNNSVTFLKMATAIERRDEEIAEMRKQLIPRPEGVKKDLAAK